MTVFLLNLVSECICGAVRIRLIVSQKREIFLNFSLGYGMGLVTFERLWMDWILSLFCYDIFTLRFLFGFCIFPYSLRLLGLSQNCIRLWTMWIVLFQIECLKKNVWITTCFMCLPCVVCERKIGCVCPMFCCSKCPVTPCSSHNTFLSAESCLK